MCREVPVFAASPMLTSIEIAGLRGIKGAKIAGLGPVTMLVGSNGSGKSSILEALGLLCAGSDVEAAFSAVSRREWVGLAGTAYWFDKQGCRVEGTRDTGSTLLTTVMFGPPRADIFQIALQKGARGELLGFLAGSGSAQGVVDEDGRLVERVAAHRALPFALEVAQVDRPAGARHRFGADRFSSGLRHALGRIKLTPWYDDLITYLQVIRPTLSSIESIAVGDRDEPHMFEKYPRVGYPIAYSGDGFRRALLLASAFAEAKGGVVAIDEPEAFAHPRLFSSVAKLIRRCRADGTEVFLATHSLEFVQVVLSEFSDEPGQCAVVGLRNDRGSIDPVVVGGADAHRRIIEMGDDLRL
jgi:hypothetical protein